MHVCIPATTRVPQKGRCIFASGSYSNLRSSEGRKRQLMALVRAFSLDSFCVLGKVVSALSPDFIKDSEN